MDAAMPFCELQDVKLYYEDSGSGEAIVFTHGHSMYHKQWKPQIEALSSRYRVIVWDVRGHGNSSLPAGAVDPESFSRDLAGLLEHLGLSSAVLCGLSMGGHISLQTAVRYPGKVKGLILIGTPFTNAFNKFERFASPFSLFSLRLLPYKWMASLTAGIMSKVTPGNRDFVMEAFGKMTKDRFLRHWRGNLRMDSRNELGKVHCPVLLLHGEQDRMVARQQQALAAGIRGAALHTIKGADHLTNLDNPEAVNRHIMDFMLTMEDKR
jgi:3-oxoadipate enol-lactonase